MDLFKPKGLALNDDRINGLTYEHEYLLSRNQEDHFLGDNPKVGDKVTINSYRSTSISREGMNYYKDPEELDRRKNWWNLSLNKFVK